MTTYVPCERCGAARHDTTFCDGCQRSLCSKCWGPTDFICQRCDGENGDRPLARLDDRPPPVPQPVVIDGGEPWEADPPLADWPVAP